MALAVVKDKYEDAVWTGLQKGKTRNWYWSLADDDFYKKGERNYLIWGNIADFNCACFKDGKLYITSCTDMNYSICFDGESHAFSTTH